MRKGSIITFVINAAIFIILEIAALNMLRNNGEMQDKIGRASCRERVFPHV